MHGKHSEIHKKRYYIFSVVFFQRYWCTSKVWPVSSAIYTQDMAAGKALIRIIVHLSVKLIETGNSFLLLGLMLNHFRLFVLGKLRYWGDQDLYSEIRLWTNLIGLIKVDKEWIAQYRLEYPKVLDRLVDLVRSEFRLDKLRALDVGSGPISKLREGREKLDLYCLDPLAREYCRLLKMSKMETNVRFIQGTCEELEQIFTKEQFHLVYASNSLDHTRDPRICMKQMFAVLKPYGVICVEGYVKEGSYLGWYGLHQHDLTPIRPNLYHSRKTGQTTNITQELSLREVHFQRSTDQRWFSMAWQKIPDGSSS